VPYVLDNLIKTIPCKGGIEVTCESDTSHLVKEYIRIEVRAPHFKMVPLKGESEDSGEAPPTLTIRVCIMCFHKHMMNEHNAMAELKAMMER
jgi:hypothetical protein